MGRRADRHESERQVLDRFAENWGLPPSVLVSIYTINLTVGTARTVTIISCIPMRVRMTPRRLRYFCTELRKARRYGTIKPKA